MHPQSHANYEFLSSNNLQQFVVWNNCLVQRTVLTSEQCDDGLLLAFLPDVGDALEDPAAEADERRYGHDEARVEDERPHAVRHGGAGQAILVHECRSIEVVTFPCTRESFVLPLDGQIIVSSDTTRISTAYSRAFFRFLKRPVCFGIHRSIILCLVHKRGSHAPLGVALVQQTCTYFRRTNTPKSLNSCMDHVTADFLSVLCLSLLYDMLEKNFARNQLLRGQLRIESADPAARTDSFTSPTVTGSARYL